MHRDPTYLLVNEASLVKKILSQSILNRSEYQHWCWLIDEITALNKKEYHAYMEKHGALIKDFLSSLCFKQDSWFVTNTYNILKKLTDTMILYT